MISPKDLTEIFSCPTCKGSLEWKESTGAFLCSTCRREYRRERGVFLFLANGHYTDSFGFQWQKHGRTQLDKFNGLSISRERFFQETGWQAEELRGRRMLEIGSGPGRFTEIALSCGAKVFSLESSDAVFVNAQNNAQDNLCLIKASLYDPPFSRESFDYLFCFGVLQHTPDVHRAFHALFAPLKTGGKFCLDLYAAPYALLHPRQMIRPFTRKMDSEKLYRRVSALVPRLLPLSDALLKIPWAGEALARLVPVANWKGHLRFRDREQSLEWSILDTFDWYSPVYEKPQFLFTLKKWCREAKFQNFSIQRLRGVYVIRGTK